MTLWPSFLAVGVGAAVGAWLRWGLAQWLNPLNARLPYGTLAANLIGGYFIGMAMAYFAAHPDLSPVWRLAIVTGFLGGLTTFSTFSYEAVQLLHGGAYLAAAAHAALHGAGSIALVLAGMASYRTLAG
jgi:CrcB protein